MHKTIHQDDNDNDARRPVDLLLSRVCRIAGITVRAQAITLMIIYDCGHKRVPSGIDLFTPEGDPHAISCRRRAVHGWPSSPPPAPPPPPRIFILLLLLLLVIYVIPPKLRFLMSSFAVVTVVGVYDGRLSLKFGNL